MVASRGEWIRKALQDTDISVEDGAGLAVQQLRRPIHRRPERDPDGLVSEGTPSSGVRAAAGPDHPDRSPGPLRCAGARAQQNAVEIPGRRGDLGVTRQPVVIVAPDLGVDSELAQVLNQVEDEAVVIVDDHTRTPTGYRPHRRAQ